MCGIKLWYFHVCFYPDLRQDSKHSNIAWNKKFKDLYAWKLSVFARAVDVPHKNFNSGSLMSHATD